LKVLGIDPGSRVTGYGVVEKQRNDLIALLQGDVRLASNDSLSSFMIALYNQLLALMILSRTQWP
jgi:crossover junction endodeoxyribonuclease RuvC